MEPRKLEAHPRRPGGGVLEDAGGAGPRRSQQNSLRPTDA